MGLLQRYIFKSVGAACLGGVGLFVFVLMTSNAVRDITSKVPLEQLSPGLVGQLFALLVPFAASLSLPLGMLIGILLVMGRLSANRELTAMRAAGLSLWHISAPLMVIALLGVGLGIYVNGWQAPTTRAVYKDLLRNVLREDPERVIVPRKFIHDFQDLVIYIGDKDGARLQQLWVWQLDDQRRVVRLLRADTAEVYYEAERDSLILDIVGGYVELRDQDDPDNLRRLQPVVSIASTSFRLPMSQAFDEPEGQVGLSQMSIPQLLERRRELQEVAATADDPTVAEEARIQAGTAIYLANRSVAMAFSILSLALIGIPLGIKAARRETHANIALALALAMAYYLGMLIVDWADKSPHLHPEWLVWLPNFVCQAVGVWLLRRAGRW
ncbi:MAG: LptF/LptG family permease [Verrucomicrobiota bacterium JB022]|nr:LptF/LptG family permease [Verrucomicrobiota bacterium JB022]